MVILVEAMVDIVLEDMEAVEGTEETLVNETIGRFGLIIFHNNKEQSIYE